MPEAEFACQTTAAPVSAAVIGTAPGPLQHLGLQSGRIGSGLAPAMLGDQTAARITTRPTGRRPWPVPSNRWPTGLGFEYFYGFNAGATHQFYPVHGS